MHQTPQLEGIGKCSGITNTASTKLQTHTFNDSRHATNAALGVITCSTMQLKQAHVFYGTSMVNAISTAVPSEPHLSPMIAVECLILRLAVLDLVVLLIAPHPLQRFNGLDLSVPLETKCPNPAANSQVLRPGVQETRMLHTCTSLLTSHDHKKYKLSTPAVNVATQQLAYLQHLPKLPTEHSALLHSASRSALCSKDDHASGTWPCSCSTCPKCKI